MHNIPLEYALATFGIVMLLDIPPRFWARLRGTPVQPRNLVVRSAMVLLLLLIGWLLESGSCSEGQPCETFLSPLWRLYIASGAVGDLMVFACGVVFVIALYRHEPPAESTGVNYDADARS